MWSMTIKLGIIAESLVLAVTILVCGVNEEAGGEGHERAIIESPARNRN